MRRMAILVVPGMLVHGIVCAGELRLHNGAVIPGELLRFEEQRLVWNAELIGEIRVEKSAVAAIDSVVPGALTPIVAHGSVALSGCSISGATESVRLACADGVESRAALIELQSLAPEKKSYVNSGKVTLALTSERSDKNTDELEFDARSRWQRTNRRHDLEASIDYEERDGDAREDEATLSYQLDFLRDQGWFRYAGVEYQRDRFSSVQEFSMLVLGIGREWQYREQLTLRLQAGPGEAYIDIEDYGRGYTELGSIKWRADWKLNWRGSSLFHEGQYHWVLERRDVYQFDTSSGFTLPLLGGLVAELRLDYDRVGITPAERNESTDIEWVLGLGYRW